MSDEDKGPLFERLVELQRDRPKMPRAHVQAARSVLDFGLREDRGSQYMVCAHHELMDACYREDDVAHAEWIITASERIVGEDAEFEATPSCRVCVLSTRADAEIAQGRFDAALASLERAKKAMDDAGRMFWSVKRGAQVLWAMVHVHLLRGDDKAVLECAAKHDSEREILVRGAKNHLKEHPEDAKDPKNFFVVLVDSAPEYYAEVEILRLVAKGLYAEAQGAIEAYFAEHGDGGSGMSMVLNTYAQALVQREAWEALVAAAPMLDREFHERQRPRWHVAILVGIARAHHALGQEDEARRVYYEIGGLRSELFEDDLDATMRELRELIFE